MNPEKVKKIIARKKIERRLEEDKAKNAPKCLICQSLNIEKITGAQKVGAVAMFGIFSSGYVSKTFKCNNCGAKF